MSSDIPSGLPEPKTPETTSLEAELTRINDEKRLMLREMGIDELNLILSSTVKFDDNTKAVLFLLCLLTFTDNEQQNIAMTGPSSQGKTWTVNRILDYFPTHDVLSSAGTTPRAFHYSDKRKPMVHVNGDFKNPVFEEIDWSKKPDMDKASEEEKKEWRDYKAKFCWVLCFHQIIVEFTDIPNYLLLENLRSLVSHDQKYSHYLTVNVSRKTESIFIEGYPSFVTCSTATDQKPEEISRNWYLNPEWTVEKAKAIQDLSDLMDTDPDYKAKLDADPDRNRLKERILAIKEVGINEIKIPEEMCCQLRKWFDEHYTSMIPKKNRDYPRFKALMKASALFNFAQRKVEDYGGRKILWCSQIDVDNATRLYEPLVKSNELGLSPEAYEILFDVVKPMLNETVGITLRDVMRMYHSKFKRSIEESRLRGFMHSFSEIGQCFEQSQGKGKPTLYLAIPKEPEKTEQPKQEEKKGPLDGYTGEEGEKQDG